jgi:hypothetical protein
MDEPHFLFVITPPYSGSTALAQVLNTARGAAILHRTGEGQWLVPGMCAEDRWNPSKPMDWDSIRATWLCRVAELRGVAEPPAVVEPHVPEPRRVDELRRVPEPRQVAESGAVAPERPPAAVEGAAVEGAAVEVVIEKSPPNLVRVDQLIKAFPNHSLMAFNRDPFAHCSSVLYRHADPAHKTDAERVDAVRMVAHGWLDRSTWLRRWIEELHVVHFTYEEFCAEPATCVETLAELVPVLTTADTSSGIRVKDYEQQELENHNARQIGLLRAPELDAISTVLRTQPALVEYFGYDTEPPPL